MQSKMSLREVAGSIYQVGRLRPQIAKRNPVLADSVGRLMDQVEQFATEFHQQRLGSSPTSDQYRRWTENACVTLIGETGKLVPDLQKLATSSEGRHIQTGYGVGYINIQQAVASLEAVVTKERIGGPRNPGGSLSNPFWGATSTASRPASGPLPAVGNSQLPAPVVR